MRIKNMAAKVLILLLLLSTCRIKFPDIPLPVPCKDGIPKQRELELFFLKGRLEVHKPNEEVRSFGELKGKQLFGTRYQNQDKTFSYGYCLSNKILRCPPYQVEPEKIYEDWQFEGVRVVKFRNFSQRFTIGFELPVGKPAEIEFRSKNEFTRIEQLILNGSQYELIATFKNGKRTQEKISPKEAWSANHTLIPKVFSNRDDFFCPLN